METTQVDHTAREPGTPYQRAAAATPPSNRQWRLIRRPTGMFSETDFELSIQPVPELAEGQFLVHLTHLSADPTQLVWARRDSYMPMQPLGEVMRGGGVGVIEQSRNARYPERASVTGLFGMQQYAVSDGTGVNILPPGVSPDAALAVFGITGIAAYFGVTVIARPRAGETMVVSGAAGAVGSLAGQIGKILGARVVGVVGSDAKCEWVHEELGLDAAINYHEDLEEGLDRYCPQGIDVYFDNTGGPILDAVLARINLHARIALCGMISDYTRDRGLPITNLTALIARRARMEGFLCFDYIPRAGEAMDALGSWLQQGRIRYRVDPVQGFDHAITAMNKLFTGANVGKVIIGV